MGSTELTGAVPLAPRAERHRSPARRLGRAVDGIQFLARLVLATLACMVVVSVVPALFGWRSYVVLSGSMSPSMRVGDVVIAAPAGANDLAAGRVVAFREPGRLGRIIVHRVQGWRADGTLITKGDANAVADSTPLTLGDVRGVVRLRLPMIALPAYWWQAGAWPPLAGAAAVLGILIWVGYSPPPASRAAPVHRRSSRRGGSHRAARSWQARTS